MEEDSKKLSKIGTQMEARTTTNTTPSETDDVMFVDVMDDYTQKQREKVNMEPQVKELEDIINYLMRENLKLRSALDEITARITKLEKAQYTGGSTTTRNLPFPAMPNAGAAINKAPPQKQPTQIKPTGNWADIVKIRPLHNIPKEQQSDEQQTLRNTKTPIFKNCAQPPREAPQTREVTAIIITNAKHRKVQPASQWRQTLREAGLQPPLMVNFITNHIIEFLVYTQEAASLRKALKDSGLNIGQNLPLSRLDGQEAQWTNEDVHKAAIRRLQSIPYERNIIARKYLLQSTIDNLPDTPPPEHIVKEIRKALLDTPLTPDPIEALTIAQQQTTQADRPSNHSEPASRETERPASAWPQSTSEA